MIDGFTNLMVSKRDGAIVLDPHVAGSCVITLDETAATAPCSTCSENGSDERAGQPGAAWWPGRSPPDLSEARGGHPMSYEDPGGCEMSTAETHPAWCSPEHCYRTDEGVRVHQQAPTRWDGECVVPLRFETSLIDPGDDDTTYLEMRLRDLKLRDEFYGLLTLDTARRLRDQLTEHLDAVK